MTAEVLHPWVVLNVDGRDPAQDFSGANTAPDPEVHAPVNYHAYAACTAGSFHKAASAVPDSAERVLVLLRQRNLVAARAAVRQLRERGCSVWVSLKESGGLQVSELISEPRRWKEFCDVCRSANGCLSSTPDLVVLYRSTGAQNVVFIPTPYPVDLPEWNFACSMALRNGIFVGTREFDVLSRRHTIAVTAAVSVGIQKACRVVVFNPDGKRGEKMLEAIRESTGIGPKLEVIHGRLAYPDYLRVMAMSRVVWQLDRSRVPGQVAGDALLCGVPCIGGDGAIDRIGHPVTHGDGKSDGELLEKLEVLMSDDVVYQSAVEASKAAAHSSLSFGKVARQLQELS